MYSAIGRGYLWSSCRDVNIAALKDILAEARSDGFVGLENVRWYNYETGIWQRDPVCRVEYGWLAGLLYTFWWPAATKVHVQARGIDPGVAGKPPRLEEIKVGAKEPTSRDVRVLKPKASGVNLDL